MLRLLGVDKASTGGLLLLLLVADTVIIALHLSMKILGEPQEYTFDLGADRGFGEFFQYVQTLWAAVLLVMLAARTRAGIYPAWVLVCVYFAADDGLQLHERAGWAAIATFPEMGSLAVHLGELAFMALVGAILVLIVGIAHRRADRQARAVSRVIAALFAVLILFGVVLDGVHHILLEYPVFDVPVTTIEDGGEIVAMSLMVVFLFATVFAGHHPGSIRDTLGLTRSSPRARRTDRATP